MKGCIFNGINLRHSSDKTRDFVQRHIEEHHLKLDYENQKINAPPTIEVVGLCKQKAFFPIKKFTKKYFLFQALDFWMLGNEQHLERCGFQCFRYNRLLLEARDYINKLHRIYRGLD